MPNPKSVQSLLTLPDKAVDRMLLRAETLGKYNEKLQSILPISLKNRVLLLNIDSQQVVLGADSAALLTQLRFDSDNLLVQLQQLPGLQDLQSLRFKVLPPPAIAGKPLPRAKMSANASQLLQQAADAFDDPDLKAAIKRLANRNDR